MVVVAGHTSPSHIALAHRQRIAGQQASGFAIWHRPGCPERNCEAIIPGEIEPWFPLGGEGSATTIKRKKKGFDLKRARDDRVPQ
jgi:hypothetical protein